MPTHPRAVLAGVVAMSLGGFVAFISAGQLLMLGLQHVFLEAMPRTHGDEFFRALIESMTGVMVVDMPAFVLLGATMLWQGNRLRQGGRDSASWIIALAFVAMGLLAVYGRDSMVGPMRLFEQVRNPFLPFEPHTWSQISLVGGGVMMLVPLLAVVILAWRARVTSDG